VSSCAWEGFLAKELSGVAAGEREDEGEHAERADGAAEVEEENAVSWNGQIRDVRVGIAEEEEVAEDEEEAELGGAEEEL
jgi:hypothetical protein